MLKSKEKRKPEDEISWITRSLRIIAGHTEHRMQSFVKNYDVVYDDLPYSKRYKILKAYTSLHDEMMISKEFLLNLNKKEDDLNEKLLSKVRMKEFNNNKQKQKMKI